MAHSKLFDPIPKTNIAYFLFSAPIDAAAEQGILDACTQLIGQGVRTVYLLISTPGGAVINGINLYSFLRSLPIRLITHNMGSVDSIGTVIFLAGSERYASPHATFMFHGVASGVNKATKLDRNQLLARLDRIAADEEKIASIIHYRASFSEKEKVSKLFHEQSTKDNQFAISRGIIHSERNVKIPTGAPIVHFARKHQGDKKGGDVILR